MPMTPSLLLGFLPGEGPSLDSPTRSSIALVGLPVDDP